MAKIWTEELSKHNNIDNAMILINSTIQDVTEFAARHLGGADLIDEHIGGDA